MFTVFVCGWVLFLQFCANVFVFLLCLCVVGYCFFSSVLMSLCFYCVCVWLGIVSSVLC